MSQRPARRRPAWAFAALWVAAVSAATAGPESGSQQHARPARSPVTSTASIQGRVTSAASSLPLRMVYVRLSDGRDIDSVTLTAADGSYAFGSLPAGTYTVEFAKAGFASQRYGQKGGRGKAIQIQLGNGQSVRHIDVALQRGGAIEGRVLDEAGEPVVEAKVTAFQVRFTGGERRLVPAGRPVPTDDRGQYRLYGLAPGRYYVSASMSPQTSGYAPTFYPDQADLALARTIGVRAGEDATAIDILFRPVRLARVSGTVVPSAGTLPGTAVVTLARRQPTGQVSARSVSRAQARPDGRFSLVGVPPGEYVIRASSIPDELAREVANTGSNAPLTKTRLGMFAAVPVTVSGADLTGLTVHLSSAGRLSGRLVVDGQPPEPSTCASTRIEVVPATAESSIFPPIDTSVRPDGAFEMGGLIGTFVIRLSGLPATAALGRVEVGGRDVTDSGVTVPSAEEVSDIEVLLDSHITQLTGRVVASEDTDTTAATVVVFSSDPERWSWPATRYVASARPNRDGSFQLAGLAPGEYLAVAALDLEEGEWQDPELLKTLARVAVPVRLWAGEAVTVSLPLSHRP